MDDNNVGEAGLQDKIRRERERLMKTYQELYQKISKKVFHAGGGIFGEKKRLQLIDRKGHVEERRKKYDFRYDVRQSVKTALIDLQLFIETSSEKDINQVLTRETLKPLLEALLWHPVVANKRDKIRPKIAQELIQTGFSYLAGMNRDNITRNQKRTIEDAIELSIQLTNFLLPESEREFLGGDPIDVVDRL